MASAIGYNSSVQFALLVGAVLAIMVLVQYGKKIAHMPVVKRRQEMTHVVAWSLFFVTAGTGLALSPPNPHGDPSVLLTVGAGLSLFSAVLQWALPPRVSTPAPCAHRSGSFALLAIAALALRLSSTMRFQGYLPTDATGDGCYQLLEALTLGTHCVGIAGIDGKDLLRAGLLLGLALATATQCYGDLDNNATADRLFAASVYAEMAAWAFMLAATLSPANRRRFCGGFVLPAFAAAACRLTFWHLAFHEMQPMKPVLLMAYFPTVLLWVTGLQMGAAALAMVCLLLPKGEVVAEIEQALAADAFLPGESKLGFRPGRAVFENGVLKVEYIAV